MSTFASASSSTVTDLHKRVRYSTGLVLGVDEFEQEQAHLLERDRLHTRALHGYGTVYGLRLEMEESPQLAVTPGLAMTPSGQHVCVGQRQCALLNDWVKALTPSDFKDEDLSIPDIPEDEDTTLSVYVVLCYRECETDAVPMSGGPCRTAEDSAVPSRIAEDFELQLRLAPPAQASEEATRAFGAFLRRIQPTEHDERAISADTFEDMVEDELETIRAQVRDERTPVTVSEEGAPIYLEASSAHASLTKAFRMWSRLEARGIDVSSNRCGVLDGNDPHCVRLGKVDLTIGREEDGFVLEDVSEADISVDDRPVLLETRLLQEYLAHGSLDAESIRRTLATVSVEGAGTLRLWFHHDELVDLAGDAPLEVEVNAETVPVNDVSAVDIGRNAFDLSLEGSVAPGDRIAVRIPLADVEEQEADVSLLDRLDEEAAPDYLDRSGEAVVVYTVAPDATLQLDDLEDVEIEDEPDTEQVLAWDPELSVWKNQELEKPDTLSIEEVAATLPTLPFATSEVVALDSLAEIYEGVDEGREMVDQARDVRDEVSAGIAGRAIPVRVRFHLNTHEEITTTDNVFDVEDFSVRVFSERKFPMSTYLYLTQEDVLGRAQLARNVFVLFVRENAIYKRPYLRLRFDLSETQINERDESGEITNAYEATEWIQERPVKWLGHDGTNYVTVFTSWESVGGDLKGADYAPRVTGIQGTSVSEEGAEEGDVLALEVRNGDREWAPTSLVDLDLSDLDVAPAGHTHALNDLSDVNADAPDTDDVLTWQNGTWAPGSGGGGEVDPSTLAGEYVSTNPETADPYAIVAAGTVILTETEAGRGAEMKDPAYGGITVNLIDEKRGLFLLSFEGYTAPDPPGPNPYVVKGTPVRRQPVADTDEQTQVPVGATFAVIRFREEGVIVQCVDQQIELVGGGEGVGLNVRPLRHMVEISQVGGR